MKTDHRSQSEVPHHKDVPFEARQSVIEQRSLSEHADVMRFGEQARKANLIVQEHKEQLTNLMGSSKYEQFRAYVAEQKRYQAELFFPPRGPQMTLDEQARIRHERREKSLAFLQKLGVEATQIQKLNKRFRDRMEEFAPPTSDKLAPVLLPSDVPSGILAPTAATIMRPPYAGGVWGWTNIYNAGFTFNPTLQLDRNTGLVGNISQLVDSDASDNDVAVYEFTALVQFWYRMPTPGLVSVWLEAESRNCQHDVSMIDEFGWSDADVTQRNFFVLRATVGGGGGRVDNQSCWFFVNDQSEGHWQARYFNIGQTYWHNIVSDSHTVFPAGAWVLVEVGTQNWQSSFANDVEVYSTMHFEWILKSVQVSSTGG
jgi:hypothetical protein